MEPIDTSESTWKGKVIRYRKWEQRHDRTVNPEDRKQYAKVMAEFYVDLSNTAREIVLLAGREVNARFNDEVDFANDLRLTRVSSSRFKYKLKVKAEEPDRIWFQRFEHEPWFDLGYFNQLGGFFTDTPPAPKPTPELVAHNRAIDMAHTRKVGFNHIVQAQSMVNAMHARTDHIHMALPAPVKNGDLIDMNSDSPEALEAAAAHAMARAAELRAIDDREPTGEEATISWEWTPEYEGARTYTFVAFRSDNGTWYATGQNMCRDGMKWREMANHKMGGALRNGTFHIVTEWSQVGGDE